MKALILSIFLLFSYSTYAACTFEVGRNECNLEVLCDGDLKYAFNLKDLVWVENSTGAYIRDGISNLSMPIVKITNFATVTELFDSLTVWKMACVAAAGSDTTAVVLADTAQVETVCNNVIGEEGVGVYTASSITLNADEYFSISILVSLDSVEITALNPISGLSESNFFLAGYHIVWTAPQCELLTEAITVDATTGQAVIAVIK